jgi:hypothetical protein
MRLAGHVARTGERRVVYRVLVGKPERKRAHGRLRHRLKDIIKMDLQEVGCGLDRAGSELGQVAGKRECGNETSYTINCGEFLYWLRTD